MLRKLIWLPLLTCLFVGCKDDKKYHDQTALVTQEEQTSKLGSILQFQRELNAEFKDPEHSPLKKKDLKNFKGLSFFDPDTTLVVRAHLKRTPTALPFDMPTTTERKAKERTYAIASFEIQGTSYTLEIYQSPDLIQEEDYADYLFLPFTDDTNGGETYGGGRYIDLRIPEGDSITIDFNKAYNPYCAYNDKYSCPLVPRINHIPLSIEAGVKDFKK